MRKITALLLTGTLMISLLAGCVSRGPKPGEETPPPANQNQSEEENWVTAEGIYVGQIDSNSIEIEINGEAMAFRIEEVQEQFEEIEEKDKVQIKYLENEYGQLILKEIIKE
ncbi:MAG: hypothetical protein AB2421_04625 [Thermotaleaceae bacterium]